MFCSPGDSREFLQLLVFSVQSDNSFFTIKDMKDNFLFEDNVYFLAVIITSWLIFWSTTLWIFFSTWWMLSVALQQYLNYHYVTPTRDTFPLKDFGLWQDLEFKNVVKSSSLPLHAGNTESHFHFQRPKIQELNIFQLYYSKFF